MKDILIMPESFCEHSFNLLCEAVPLFAGEYKPLFFRSSQTTVRIAGLGSNFDTFIAALNCHQILYRFVDEMDINEYFFNHRYASEIRMSPVRFYSSIVANAALLDYHGRILICSGINKSVNRLQFRDIQGFTDIYLLKSSFGIKSLNNDPVPIQFDIGSECVFTLGGIEFRQTIRRTNDAGNEGFTMVCEGNPDIRIKILEGKCDLPGFGLDKIRAMTEYQNKPAGVALPLALVYNQSGKPIGYAMKNWPGKSIKIKELHTFESPLVYVRQILEQVNSLTVHSFLHKDLLNNILYDKLSKTAHIIDTHTIQFANWPPMSKSADKNNCLPVRYDSNRHFYNTIDLSYSMLHLLVAALMDPSDLFENWNSAGYVNLRSEGYTRLQQIAPKVAEMVYRSQNDGFPAAFIRQLEAIDALLSPSAQPVVTPVDETDDPEPVISSPPVRIGVPVNGTGGGTIPYEIIKKTHPVVVPVQESPGGTITYPLRIAVSEKPEATVYTISETPQIPDTAADAENPVQESPAVIPKQGPVTPASTQPFHPTEAEYHSTLLKRQVLKWFMKGTVNEGETEQGNWELFMKRKLWKKPALAASLGILSLIAMVAAAAVVF